MSAFDRVCLWLDAHWSVVNPATCFGGVYVFIVGVSLAFVVSPWFLLLLLLAGLAAATNVAAFRGQTLRLRVGCHRAGRAPMTPPTAATPDQGRGTPGVAAPHADLRYVLACLGLYLGVPAAWVAFLVWLVIGR